MFSLKKQLKFFVIPYHSGAFNIAMHIMSGIAHYVAFSTKNIPLVIAAFALEEIGHWYDYSVRFNSENRKKSIQIIPLKLILVTIFVLIMMWAFNWF